MTLFFPGVSNLHKHSIFFSASNWTLASNRKPKSLNLAVRQGMENSFFFFAVKNLHALVSISSKELFDLVKSLNFHAPLKYGKTH